MSNNLGPSDPIVDDLRNKLAQITLTRPANSKCSVTVTDMEENEYEQRKALLTSHILSEALGLAEDQEPVDVCYVEPNLEPRAVTMTPEMASETVKFYSMEGCLHCPVPVLTDWEAFLREEKSASRFAAVRLEAYHPESKYLWLYCSRFEDLAEGHPPVEGEFILEKKSPGPPDPETGIQDVVVTPQRVVECWVRICIPARMICMMVAQLEGWKDALDEAAEEAKRDNVKYIYEGGTDRILADNWLEEENAIHLWTEIGKEREEEKLSE